jgi:hypothetical protein
MPCRKTPQGERMLRVAREEEQRRKLQHRVPQNRDPHGDRLKRLEMEWAQFGQQVKLAHHAQMRQALLQHHAAMIADIERHFNPPTPAPGPEVIYVEATEGSDQLGTSDFNPKLWMQKPRPLYPQ